MAMFVSAAAADGVVGPEGAGQDFARAGGEDGVGVVDNFDEIGAVRVEANSPKDRSRFVGVVEDGAEVESRA